VASYHFSRLGGFYSSEFLKMAKVVEVERVPVPPLSALGLTGFGEFVSGNYAGITFLDTYFVQSGEALRESLHFHELVHVVQWQQLGAERFVMACALGYLQGGGYRANPLEVMAYDLQDYFEKGVQPIDVESSSVVNLTVSCRLLTAPAKENYEINSVPSHRKYAQNG
jgi:hypothetical protein